MSEQEGSLPNSTAMPLRTRTVRNLGVVLGFRALTLFYQVVKARYLTSVAVGVVTIGETLVGFVQTFADPGIERAAVQVPGDDRVILNTAMWIRFAFALPCYAALWFVAPWWGRCFGHGQATEVTWVVRLVGANLVLGVVSLVPSAQFTRSLRFGRVETAQFAAIVVSSCLGIYLLRTTNLGYKAVAISAVVNIACFTFGSVAMNPSAFRLVFDRESARRLATFGKFAFISGVLIYLINYSDNAMMAWFRNASEVGIYAMAFQWGNRVVLDFTQVASKVMFPTLSRLQGEPERFRNGYLMTLRLGAFLVCPLALGLAAVAPQFVHVVLGVKWERGVTPLLPYWCLYGCLRSFANVHGDALAASGHPRLVALTSVIFLALVLPIGILVTPSGGALALTETFLCVSFFANLLAMGMVRRVIGVPLGSMAASLLRPLLAAGLMACAVIGLARVWPGVGKVHLLALVVAGACVYSLASMALQRTTLAEAWRLVCRAVPGAGA